MTTTLHKSTVDKIVLGDSHFLSKTNPTATVDQRDLEALALKIVKMPIIAQAKAYAAQGFRILGSRDVPAEGWRDFDDMMEEWALHYVMFAVNSDSNYPKALGHNYSPPHEWFGMKVPASRGPGTAENSDNNYTLIPLDGRARFELHGKRLDPAVGDCPMQVTTNLPQSRNVASFDWRDVIINPDGTFVITIDPEPANGRQNHLQTTLDSRYLFVREARMDWRQLPNAYRIRRMDPPTAPPLSVEQIAAVAARFIVEDVAPMYWFGQMATINGPNVLPEVVVSSNVGGMPTQRLACFNLKIADDEAYVLNLGPGGAKYWFIGNCYYLMMSGNYWSRTSSLNNGQSVADADGSYTYVFSLRDPGVHNWVDTIDLHEPLIMIRWQLLPKTPGGPGGNPWLKGQLVKLNDLERVVPAETKWVTPEERKQLLAERLELFNLRHAI